MTERRHSKGERLYRVAETQAGYFTTKQAKAAGYAENNFPHHVRTGSWIREHRSIYRLSRFPESEDSQLVLWSLWSRNRFEIPQGVYSHETALRIHDLSDVMPTKLHVTVPMAFRRNSDVPAILVLHRADLSSTDIERMQGFQVTRPLPTLLDLMNAETVSLDFIEQALKQGLKSGLISRRDIATYKGHARALAAIRECMARIRR